MGDITRQGKAQWNGGLKDGTGKTSAGSGSFSDLPYSVPSRFESGKGTNPEELIASAHGNRIETLKQSLPKALAEYEKATGRTVSENN